MKRSIASLAASAFLVALLGAAPARAAFVTFVSDDGNDSNDCLSIANACRQIQGDEGALAKTDSGGVVHVLPGEYFSFGVSGKSVEIIADNGQASIVIASNSEGPPNVPGHTQISVNLAAGNVLRVRGFILYGAGHGISIGGAGGIVHVENCTFIARTNGYGIAYAPSSASELYVKDSHISHGAALNFGTGEARGILIKPVGAGSANVVLDNVSVEDSVLGILVEGRFTTGSNNVVIRNSSVAGSSTYGVAVVDAGGGSTKAVVESTTITGNTTQGLGAYGANTTVRVKNSTISGNGQGLESSGAQLISHGGNAVADNAFNGSFSSTVAPQ